MCHYSHKETMCARFSRGSVHTEWPHLYNATNGNTRSVSRELTSSQNTSSSGNSNTLFLISRWKYDDVSLHSVCWYTTLRRGLAQVKGQERVSRQSVPCSDLLGLTRCGYSLFLLVRVLLLFCFSFRKVPVPHSDNMWDCGLLKHLRAFIFKEW